MPNLILVRHGQSQWNLENRFTGWVDVELSPTGEEEARKVGAKIADYPIDLVFTSVLKRAIKTADIALAVAGKSKLPIERDQALNERMYGDLQGLNKDETRAKHGDAQVLLWRRSYDIRPPGGESLKDTCERVLPYYEAKIKPALLAGKNVLIVAHGNSLRGLVKELEGLSGEAIVKVEIGTGVPLVYELDAAAKVVRKTVLE